MKITEEIRAMASENEADGHSHGVPELVELQPRM
jgi:hypothetical protein